MKLRLSTAIAATLFAGTLAMAADSSWTGWISDSQCGAKGANDKAAELEAMQTLIGMAQDSVFGHARPDMAIEVRSATEELFCTALIHRNTGPKH